MSAANSSACSDRVEDLTISQWVGSVGRRPDLPMSDENVEVVLKILEARRAYPDASEAYLTRVARNARLNYRRSVSRQACRAYKHKPLADPSVKEPSMSDLPINESMITRDLVAAILAKAEDLQIKALLLLLLDGATLADAAKTCDIPYRTAKRRVQEVRTYWEATF